MFQWMAPQLGGDRRLTKAIMAWLWVFTGLTLTSWFIKSSGCLACPKPILQENLCEAIQISGNVTDAMSQLGGRRLGWTLPDGSVLMPGDPAYFDAQETTEQATDRLLRTIYELRESQWGGDDLPYHDGFKAGLPKYLQYKDAARALSENRETVDANYLTVEEQLALTIAQCKADAEVIYKLKWQEYDICMEQYLITIPNSRDWFYKLCTMEFVVMGFCAFLSFLIVFVYEFAFKKTKVRTKKSITEKLRIVQFWKMKELFAMAFAMIWIGCCIFYLMSVTLAAGAEDSAARYFVTAFLMKITGPYAAVFVLSFLILRAPRLPVGRFVLTLVPALYDFRHNVIETPEDIVATRRARQKRKDKLRKEVRKLEARIHPDQREEAVRSRSKDAPGADPARKSTFQ